MPAQVTSLGGGACRSSGLTRMSIPQGVGTIGLRVFCECAALVDVVIPQSVKCIGTAALTRVSFPSVAEDSGLKLPSALTHFGEDAFQFCSHLTEIVLPPSVTSIGDGAFKMCRSSKRIAIPEGVVTLGNRVFSY
jgi:hypothetical protein